MRAQQPVIVERNTTSSNSVNVTVNAIPPVTNSAAPTSVNWLQSLTITEETFDPESQVVRTQTSSEETSISRESRPQGFAGTAGNIEGSDVDAAALTTSNTTDREQRTRNQTFEISRAQINRVQPAGKIRSVSAAVFIAPRPSSVEGQQPTPRTNQELQRLRDMIALTLGITDPADIARLVSVEEAPFSIHGNVAFQTYEAGWDVEHILELTQNFAPIGLALVFFLILLHMLRRTRPEPIFNVSNQQDSVQEAESTENMPISPEVLNELIRQKPENVGTALRNWVNPNRNS